MLNSYQRIENQLVIGVLVPRPTEVSKTFTVLVVENEPIVRMGIADHLRSHGYIVIEAASGDRAMDKVRPGNPIDVIVTDVRMPGAARSCGLGATAYSVTRAHEFTRAASSDVPSSSNASAGMP